MCGVIGYLAKEGWVMPAKDFLIVGLNIMNRRGYEGAGVCIAEKDELFLHKIAGSPALLVESLKGIKSFGTLGIGHNRWPSQGKAEERNSHPFVSMDGKIAVAHNGIIENHRELKFMLEDEGFAFSSDTDSETLVHLIAKNYAALEESEDRFERSVAISLRTVEGAYGIVAIRFGEDKLVAAAHGSEVRYGVGEQGYFIASASDVLTGLYHGEISTGRLGRGELAVFRKNGFSIHDVKTMDSVEKGELQRCEAKKFFVNKLGYGHFMVKEIMEQSEVISRAVDGRVTSLGIKLDLGISSEEIHSIRSVVLLGCGSSLHAGMIGKDLLRDALETERYGYCVSAVAENSSEFQYSNFRMGKETLAIAISQSGETKDTHDALLLAKRKGAMAMGLVNNVLSPIFEDAGKGMCVKAGLEVAVASTKAFVAQVTCFHVLAEYMRQELGLPPRKELLESLLLLPEMAKETLVSSFPVMEEWAETFYFAKNVLFLGKGLHYPVALEGALKMKEVCYIHAEGMPASELKHGPIALVDENMPVVAICMDDDLMPKMRSNLEEVVSRGGRLFVVTDNPDLFFGLAVSTVKVPKIISALSPLLSVIPLQLLAYHVAVKKGNEVDNPRNLAKTATVN